MKCDSFESAETIKLLLDSIRKWEGPGEEWQVQVVVVAWLLARNDSNKVHIVKEGGVRLSLDIMKQNLEDATLLTELLALLRNVAHSDEGTATIITEGAVGVVKAAMAAHSGDVAVQTEGLALLGNVAYNCEDGHNLILQEGIVARAIDVLKEHEGSEMVVRAALIMIWKVAHHNAAGGSVVISQGCMLPIITAMRLHSSSGAVQIRALRALDELIKQNKENVLLLILEGGIHPLFQPTAFVASASLRAELVRHVQYHCKPVLKTLLAIRSCPITELHVRLGLLYLSDTMGLNQSFSCERDLACITDMLGHESEQVRVEGARAVQYLLQATDVSTEFKPPPLVKPCNSPQNFAAFLNDEALCDVIFQVEGRPYHAHRIVLKASTSSVVFSAMMSHPMREASDEGDASGPTVVNVEDIKYETFAGLLEFLYTGDVKIGPESATEMLMAAERFLISPLQQHCIEVISAHLDVENLWTAYDIANQCQVIEEDNLSPAESLHEACACCLLKNLETFCKDPQFLKERGRIAQLVKRKVWKALHSGNR